VRTRQFSLAATVAAAGIAGCHSSDSSDGGAGGTPIKTRDMYIKVTVEAADEVTAKVSAWLNSGDPFLGTYYTLTGGDTLSACVGSVCKPLSHNVLKYEADLPYVAETPYVISLSRQVDVSAPDTVVTLPVPFTILAPGAGLRVTDGDVVTVQWSPAGADNTDHVTNKAVCDQEDGARSTRSAGGVAGVNGSAVVHIDEIIAARPRESVTQARLLRCDVVLEVVHVRYGTADKRFGGEGIAFVDDKGVEGLVTRAVTLAYTPSQP
jgi:hypothetical protein